MCGDVVLQVDGWLFVPVALGVVSMVFWAKAYGAFPGVIREILEDVNMGPFGTHLRRMSIWVELCGVSHWIMGARDIAMLAAMYMVYIETYWFAVAFLFISLAPLFGGGFYSVYAINRLKRDARDINKFIHAAEQVGKRLAEHDAS